MPEKQHNLISTNEVAELIGKDPRTVQRMAAAGELPAMKMPGQRGAYIFHRSDFPTTPASDAPPSLPGAGVPFSSGLAPEPDQPNRSTL